MTKNQLSDDIHQVIEFGDIDPYRPAEAFCRQRRFFTPHRDIFNRIQGYGCRCSIETDYGDILSLHHCRDFYQGFIGAEEYFKIYGESETSAAAREGTDNLSLPLQNIGQLTQVLIECRQIEGSADGIDPAAPLGILPKPMLFIFGQSIEQLGGDAESCQRIMGVGSLRIGNT